MKIRIATIALAMLLICTAGCSARIDTKVTPPPVAEAPAASPEPTPEPTPEPPPAPSVTLSEHPGVTLSLGMSLYDVQASLTENDMDHTYHATPEIGYDEMTDEARGLSFTDASVPYYLGFTDGGELAYIIWSEALDIAESELTPYIAAEIAERGELPAYTGGGLTDIFVFELEGGYYTQTHYRLKDEFGGVNSVNCRLTLDDNSARFPDSGRNVYLLGDDTTGLGQDGIGSDAALSAARQLYGEVNEDGLLQSYAFEGMALHERQLWYSIRWAQLVDDHSSYNGNIYVSLDGAQILTGDFYTIENDV